MNSPASTEQTGEKFNLQTYFAARDLCKKVVATVAGAVEFGMNEDDGQSLIREEFRKVGVTKFWHPSKFRIGADTLKTFRDLPDKEIRLTSGDIFFLDVGPVVDEHEADIGETFVFEQCKDVEEDALKLVEASKAIWSETAELWRSQSLSGADLYKKAESLAQAHGYQLNPLMAGHRLGDFPHALFSKQSLLASEFTPSANLWVLEIHIRSPELQRGAFYEDILMDSAL